MNAQRRARKKAAKKKQGGVAGKPPVDPRLPSYSTYIYNSAFGDRPFGSRDAAVGLQLEAQNRSHPGAPPQMGGSLVNIAQMALQRDAGLISDDEYRTWATRNAANHNIYPKVGYPWPPPGMDNDVQPFADGGQVSTAGFDDLFGDWSGPGSDNSVWQDNAEELRYIDWLARTFYGGNVDAAVNALNSGTVPSDGDFQDYIDQAHPAADGSGSDGGGSVAEWRPGEFGLESRSLDLENRRIDNDIAQTWYNTEEDRARRELDWFSARGEVEGIQKSESRLLEIGRAQVQIEQERNRLDGEQMRLDQDIAQQQTYLDQRGQDITQRGQDTDAMFSWMDRQLQVDETMRQDALARGDFEQANAIERRMQYTAETQNQLAQQANQVDVRAQDINANIEYNNQLIDRYQAMINAAQAEGNIEAQQDAERRLAATQQQNAALEWMSQSQAGTSAMTGAAQAATNLASSMGNIELQRQQMLAETSANPRDFVQYNMQMGNPLGALLSGIAPGANIDSGATLGEGWENLTNELMTRRDLPYFEQAAGYIGDVAQMAQRPSELGLADVLALGPRQESRRSADIGPGPSLYQDYADQPSWMNFDQNWGPQPTLGAQRREPNLQFQMPGREGQLDYGSIMNPFERQLFNQFFDEAPPGTPWDIGLKAARYPEGFRTITRAQPPFHAPNPPNLGSPTSTPWSPSGGTPPGGSNPPPGGGNPPPGGGGPPWLPGPGQKVPESGNAPVFTDMDAFREYQRQNRERAYASQPPAPPAVTETPGGPVFTNIDDFRRYQQENRESAYGSQPAAPAAAPTRATETPEQRAARLAASKAARAAARR